MGTTKFFFPYSITYLCDLRVYLYQMQKHFMEDGKNGANEATETLKKSDQASNQYSSMTELTVIVKGERFYHISEQKPE